MTDSIVRLVIRQDPAAEWDLYDPVLANGEFGLDTTNRILKLGDGVASWSELQAYVDSTGTGDSGASAPYTAGLGLTLSGQRFAIDSAVVARGYYGTCVATTDPQTFTTGLGTDKLSVTVWEGATQVFPEVTRSSDGSGKVTITWNSAPSVGQYSVAVVAVAAT